MPTNTQEQTPTRKPRAPRADGATPANRKHAPKSRKRAAGTGAPSTERRTAVAVAAYFRAEQRGFAPGAELDDWLAAEREYENGQPPGKA